MISSTTIPMYIKEKINEIITFTCKKYSTIDKTKIFNLSINILINLFEKSNKNGWISFIDYNFSKLKAIVLFAITKEYKGINIRKASTLLGIRPRWVTEMQSKISKTYSKSEEIKRAEFLLKNIPKNDTLIINPETIEKAILIAKKFGNVIGTKSNIIASVSLAFSCQIDSNKKIAYYKYARIFNVSQTTVYSYNHLFKKVKLYILEKKEPSISKCIGFIAVDILNFIGQIASNIKNNNDLQKKIDLVNELQMDIKKVQSLILSYDFLSRLNDICKKRNLPLISMESITKTIIRYYCKSIIDVFKKGSQINVEKLNLPISPKELVIENRVKYTNRDDFNVKYSVMCDIDHLIIMAMTELLTMRKYKPIDLRYIIIGSGDKDFARICDTAKKSGLIVVAISHSYDKLSRDIIEVSDMSIVLYPKIIFVKH